MTSNGSAKRTSEETERQNDRHRGQKEEERVDTGDQDELRDRHYPALFVEPFHRQENVERDDREQEQRNRFSWCDLGKGGRADQRDEGESVNAQREDEMVNEIKLL